MLFGVQNIRANGTTAIATKRQYLDSEIGLPPVYKHCLVLTSQ